MNRSMCVALSCVGLTFGLCYSGLRLEEYVQKTNGLADGEGKRPAVETVFRGLAEGEKEMSFFGPELKIDKIYQSMEGPGRTEWMALDPGSKELDWIQGARAVMVTPETDKPMSQEFMCHTNIALVKPSMHIQREMNKTFNNGYLFTISQGQEEVRLPEGFGIPILGGAPLMAGMQALNLDSVPEKPFGVRHRVSFIYRKNSELKTPLKPLLASAVGILKPMDEVQSKHQPHLDMSGGGCLITTQPSGAGASACKPEMTGTWDVKVGREVSRNDVTEMLALPYDTKVHYLFAHVHPFAESLELRDLTTNTSVVKLKMKQQDNKVGLSRTEHFTSIEGLPVYKNHKYELVCIYNNTSDSAQTAMAVMQMFFDDKEFVAADAIRKAQAKSDS